MRTTPRGFGSSRSSQTRRGAERTRSSASQGVDRADPHEHLPDALAAKEPEECAGGVLGPLDDRLPVAQAPVAHPARTQPRGTLEKRSRCSLVRKPSMRSRLVSTMKGLRGAAGSTSLYRDIDPHKPRFGRGSAWSRSRFELIAADVVEDDVEPCGASARSVAHSGSRGGRTRRRTRARGARRPVDREARVPDAWCDVPGAAPDAGVSALSVIPSLKITDRGLVDVDRRELVPLAYDGVPRTEVRTLASASTAR